MDAARQRAELLERLRELVRGGVEEGRGVLRIRRQLRLGEPESEGKRDEALLRAVVEVALEAAALGVAGLQEALARMPELLLLALALGDLHPRDEEVGSPVLVEERCRRPGDDGLAAAGRAPAVLVLPRRALGSEGGELGVHLLHLVRDDEDLPEPPLPHARLVPDTGEL